MVRGGCVQGEGGGSSARHSYKPCLLNCLRKLACNSSRAHTDSSLRRASPFKLLVFKSRLEDPAKRGWRGKKRFKGEPSA